MPHSLRTTTALLGACLLTLCALPAAAQQPSDLLPPHHPLVSLFANSGMQAQAVFAPKKYRTEILMDEATPPAYRPLFETTRQYADGRVTEEITQTADFFSGSMELKNSTRTTYDFANGRAIRWQWKNDAWAPDNRTTYTYSGGRLVTQLEEEYDEATSKWVNDSRTTTTYTSGLPTQFLVEDWNGTAWVPDERTLLTEQNGGVLTTDQDWNGTAWVNDGRTFMPNTTLSELAQLQQELDIILSFGFFIFAPTRDLAEAIYAQEYTDEDWNGTAWVNESRVRVTSDTPTTITALEESWDGSAWVATDRTTLNFSGTLTSTMTLESYESSAWKLDSKTAYTYDGNNNPILIEVFVDDDEDGAFDALASQRTLIDWMDIGTAVEGDADAARARLASVQPSPATDAATVHFSLTAPGPVLLRLFDVLGREVATLAAGPHAAGVHEARLDASPLPSGVYFVRLEAEGVSETRSLVVAH